MQMSKQYIQTIGETRMQYIQNMSPGQMAF